MEASWPPGRLRTTGAAVSKRRIRMALGDASPSVRPSPCAACGLYYLAELAEEYSALTRRIISGTIAVSAAPDIERPQNRMQDLVRGVHRPLPKFPVCEAGTGEYSALTRRLISGSIAVSAPGGMGYGLTRRKR
jgi:hypothetical protein